MTDWNRYVVSPADPSAAYTTIQAAIDAAVAAGHDATHPTTVLVFPGDYAEDVTLHAGIDVVGVNAATGTPASYEPRPVVAGRVSLADEDGAFRIAGLRLRPPEAPTPEDALAFDSPTGNVLLVTVDRCVFEVTNLSTQRAVCGRNSGGGLNSLTLVDCAATTATGANPTLPLVDLRATALAIYRTTLDCLGGTTAPVVATDVAALTLEDAWLSGGLRILSNPDDVGEAPVVRRSRLGGVDSGLGHAVGAIELANACDLALVDTTLFNHDAADAPVDTWNAVARGDATACSVALSGVRFEGNVRRLDPALRAAEVGHGSAGATSRWGAGTGFVGAPVPAGRVVVLGQPYELVVVDTTGQAGPVTVRLPPCATALPTKPLRVLHARGAQAVLVAPASGDRVNLDAAFALTLAAGQAATFAADRDVDGAGGSTWYRVG